MPAYVVKNNNPQVRASIASAAKQATAKAALDTEAEAKLQITAKGAVDTGAMRASVYASTPYMSHYQKAASEAKSEAAKGSRKLRRLKKAKPKKITLFPERIPENSPGHAESLVAVAANYGGYVEYGTRRMPARAFMKPSEEKIRPAFVSACKRLLEEQMGTIK
jgi:hypothetical protein